MSVTIKDIAKIVGVSHTTVSRVLNNSPRVSPETREKILRTMKELNFSPHLSARSLSSGKTYTIGLLILYDLQQFPADFLPPILAGMTTKLNEYGYNLTLFFDQIEGRKNQVPLERLVRGNMDGLFLLSVETEAELAYKAAQIDIPLVLVNQRIENIDLNYVVADDEGGAYSAVSHLLDLGHRQVAFIGGVPKYKTSMDRRAGYIRALSDRGINFDSRLERIGHFDKDKGYHAMRELIAEVKGITAVFCANDLMALGAIKAIREAGLRIPNDIAVVGFDDAEFAEAIEPSLTTVKKTRTMMGSEAARVMLEILNSEGHKEKYKVILPTRLIVRDSTIR